MTERYQAVLVLSFGGPEKKEDVIPFLERVLRGRNVPRDRMLEVAEHYYHFGGRSPINDQNRGLMAALTGELEARGPRLPVYWGNRNWHPFLGDTLREMASDGIERAMVFVTSAFGSYSGCRQYLEDIDSARAELGPSAPRLDKLRGFHNHPGFIGAVADRVRKAFEQIPPERRESCGLLFTAHSIPAAMASGSPYVGQLTEACRLVAKAASRMRYELAYQSRSGPPGQPWLEPDISETLRRYRETSGPGAHVVVSPIGFISDHMEVVYDLDTEAARLARSLDLNMIRAGTPGDHPQFIAMIRELIAAEAVSMCEPGCCPAPRRPAA
jgi:ferrochelatase